MMIGAVDGFDGSYGGLTPLAGAVQDAAGDDGVEDFGLVRVRCETEREREVDGCGDGRKLETKRSGGV